MVYQEPRSAVIFAKLGGDAKQDSAGNLLESSFLPVLALPLGDIPFLNHLTWQGPLYRAAPYPGVMGWQVKWALF